MIRVYYGRNGAFMIHLLCNFMPTGRTAFDIRGLVGAVKGPEETETKDKRQEKTAQK